MYQGLIFILALSALWLIALGVFLGYNAGVSEGALRLRQRNGDAECDGFLRINRGVVGTGYVGASTLQVNGHTERDREGSIAKAALGVRYMWTAETRVLSCDQVHECTCSNSMVSRYQAMKGIRRISGPLLDRADP